MTLAGVVLVVDDDADLLELVSFILEQEGYCTLRATNGSEALERVASEMPDLILLDLKMPVMDGYRFAELFRERYGDPAPIVVLTAADDPCKRAAEIDAAGVLSKPFGYDELLELVERTKRR